MLENFLKVFYIQTFDFAKVKAMKVSFVKAEEHTQKKH